MKIKEVKLNKFKRFTDLTITDIPKSAKLVVLVGPNGCGKTSVFEAFNYWYKSKGFYRHNNQDYYLKESDKEMIGDSNWYDNRVLINAYDLSSEKQADVQGRFYFRTAHRNEPDFTTHNLAKQENPQKQVRYDTLMSTDMSVSENYQRLVSYTLSEVFDEKNDSKPVKSLREELIGKVRRSLTNVFDDLQLSNIGDPLVNGSFYFTKGQSKDFHYKNLSAGEKSAFDLLLDLVIKTTYFNDTVFCIDEPETHMHTALQSKLLNEIYALIPENSQLWLSTHSIGMLKEANELEEKYHGSVIFLDFSNMEFDSQVIIKPSTIDRTIWNKFLELAFGDFAKLIAPKRIVFCEGTTKGRLYKDFDAQIYEKIFSSKYVDTSFISIGSCSEIENPNNISMQIISQVMKNSTIIKLVDRDDKSPEEVQERNKNNIKVLNRRHIESYLFDDEIIAKLCQKSGQLEKREACIIAKADAIQNSINRGNPHDDIKSASGDIYNALKKILSLTQCGNTKDAFLRDTITPLITEDTEVYKALEQEIFS